MTTFEIACSLLIVSIVGQPHPLSAPGVTSLTNKSVKFTVPKQHYVELKRGPVTVVIVDNAAVDAPSISGHRAGYNGVAVLKHQTRGANLYVPPYAGLNLEHIHDGTLAVNKEKFEPRRSAMQLRVVDEFTVEVYQPPTPNWKLESCGRYHVLPDGTIEYTFECIPRANVFRNGYIGLFWASYIHQPEDRTIHFQGRPASQPDAAADWIRAVTPRHGVDSTHPPDGPLPNLKIDPNFPLTLVNHRSKYIYTEPWYFGVSHGMAYVLMFRKRDRIWFAQSPTGGGSTNPAWDFQWFVRDYKVGEAYGFVIRAGYVPFKGREQLERFARRHLDALNSPRREQNN